MRKLIRCIEVPVYLIAIGVGCLNDGQTGLAVSLMVISLVRLWVNVVTDSTVYRGNE